MTLMICSPADASFASLPSPSRALFVIVAFLDAAFE